MRFATYLSEAPTAMHLDTNLARRQTPTEAQGNEVHSNRLAWRTHVHGWINGAAFVMFALIVEGLCRCLHSAVQRMFTIRETLIHNVCLVVLPA